jgi:hypothetical protein
VNLAGIGACSKKTGEEERNAASGKGDPDFEEVAWYGIVPAKANFSLNVYATVRNARVLLAQFPIATTPPAPGVTYGPFNVVGNAAGGFDVDGSSTGPAFSVPILSTRDPHTNITIYAFALHGLGLGQNAQLWVTAVAFGKESTGTSSASGGPATFPPIDPRSPVTTSVTAALNELLQTNTTGGPITVTLPTTGAVQTLPSSRQPYVVYLTDAGFDNATNNVTVQVGAGWQVQDPQTNLLSAVGGFVTLANNGATTGWYAYPTSSTTGIWYALF